MWPFNRKKEDNDILKEADNIVYKAQNPICPSCGSRKTSQVFEWNERIQQHVAIVEVFRGQQARAYRCTKCNVRFYV